MPRWGAWLVRGIDGEERSIPDNDRDKLAYRPDLEAKRRKRILADKDEDIHENEEALEE